MNDLRIGRAMSVVMLFEQDEWWKTLSGHWVRIADMTEGHRYNTAAMLMRDSLIHAVRYLQTFTRIVDQHDGGEVAHSSLERAVGELEDMMTNEGGCGRWLQSTPLYRALTAGLTVQGDGTEPWQKTGRHPVIGEPVDVPPPMVRVCQLPACGCSGEEHP